MPKGGKHVGKIASKGSSSLSRSNVPVPSSSKTPDLTPSVASVLDELTSLVKQTQVCTTCIDMITRAHKDGDRGNTTT